MNYKDNLPTQNQDKKVWTRNAMFPIQMLTNKIVKYFNSLSDVLSLITLLSVIIIELTGESAWGLYIVLILLITVSFFEKRNINTEE